MFPTTGIDEHYLDQLDEGLRSGRIAPVVANRGIERSDEVRRMLASRASDATAAPNEASGGLGSRQEVL
jgi:hypothetical protein